MFTNKNNFLDKDIYNKVKHESDKYFTDKKILPSHEEYQNYFLKLYMKKGGKLLRPRIILERSPLKYKKWRVYLPDGSHVDYGDDRYQDYTQHKNLNRKNSYRNRHKHDNIENPHFPGFWSWHHLWTYQDGKKAFKNAEKKAIKYFIESK